VPAGRRAKARAPRNRLALWGTSATRTTRPEDFLETRKGYVVADPSNLFDVAFKSPERIDVVQHTPERGFVKALDAGDLRASVPIAAFKALYDVEADCAGMAPRCSCASGSEDPGPCTTSFCSGAKRTNPSSHRTRCSDRRYSIWSSVNSPPRS